MPTQCRPISCGFQACRGRKVTAAFDGGTITSDGGSLLLREIDGSMGLFDRVAACFTDRRDARLVEHSVHSMVAQRITGLALGYEDLNDHDVLRHDPVLALLSDKLEGGRKGCAPVAGKSTLNRLEHAPGNGKPERYHKIARDPEALQVLLTELFIDAWPGRLPPSRLVLDIDSTDDAVHGRRRAPATTATTATTAFCRSTSSAARTRCAPCSARATPIPLRARSRRPGASSPGSGGNGPGLEILIRADSAYAREELLA